MQTIATDSPFTDAHTTTLTRLVGMMIPASTDYDVPGADDPEILADILGAARQHAEVVTEGLDEIETLADAGFSSAFAELVLDEAMAVVEKASARFTRALVSITVQCYYRDPRVMQSLGMQARPPFPQGFELAEGDWSLLEPVRKRGKIWRDAP